VGFENALYRAYHRWVADFCGQAPRRLKWTVVANMRDVRAGVGEVRYWARTGIPTWSACTSRRRSQLTERAKRKILAENALRLCTRLRG
jgi:hypothetical protein